MKTILAILTTIAALTAQSEEIKITKATKKIFPTHMIMQFSEIDWWEIKKENAQNKKLNHDSLVMQCDDSYFEKAEITTEGKIGGDLKLINNGCKFISYWTDGSKTNKKFWYYIHDSC